jgi:ornithine carbamoyltransferase
MKRDLIAIKDLTTAEVLKLLKSAADLKKKRNPLSEQLKGKVVALLFQKPSNRTRVSFEVGVYQLGGRCIYLNPGEINLGKRETAADVGRTLSRYVDAIVARTFRQEDVEDLAKYATIPVINGLSDMYHPCQALADIMTVQENYKKFKGVTLAYIGDGNNVCHSLMMAGAKVGLNISVATPIGYEPNAGITKIAQDCAKKSGSKILLTNSAQEAVTGAHVIYTDVWTSMGQEEESQVRLKAFQGFQINAQLLSFADKKYIFMHCLPAHRGEEVTDEVLDGKHSVVFDQAENRLHAQKAVLLFLMNSKRK